MLRRYLTLGVVVALAAVTFTGSLCNKTAKAKWTIMAYYDGNCDLDISKNNNSWVVAEAQEAEMVGSTEEVQMIAMVGSVRLGGMCKYYRIEKNENELPDSLKSTVLENLGTKDMSDRATLRNFIGWVAENYPAERYMLMIKNHGGGWRGACLDQQNGAGAMMTMPEIREALDTFHFDVIAFDACLMGMCEVAYELRSKADYLVASQFVTYAGTYGSAEWLGYLTGNPEATGLDLAKKIVEACMNANNRQQFTGQQAAIDLSKMDALAARIGNLGNALVTASGERANEIYDAFDRTHSTDLDDPAFCDLREFCKNILQEEHLKEITAIKTATDDVVSGINDAVPMTMTNAVGISRGGLCIHFPWEYARFDSANYVQCQWRSTNWHSFLSKFIAALGGGGGTGTLVINSTPTGADIYINDTKQNEQTNVTYTDVPAGTYKVKLTKSGYEDWVDDNVVVQDGQTTTVDATLQPSGGGPATVTGNVSWPGHGLSPNCYAFIDTISGSQAYSIAFGTVDQGTGNYSISVTLGGPLQVVAESWDDVNGNQQYDQGVDGWGFYDKNGDNNWDQNDLFTIQPGQTYPNINITLDYGFDSRCTFRRQKTLAW